jgi:ankyrin repeat protein
MDSAVPTEDDPVEQIKRAFHADAADQVRELLERHTPLKAMINEPIGPFDSPAIVCARSRQMVDVLLAAGADLNAKSRWWAGGFGLLHAADPELAAYAIERGAIVDVHAAARLGTLEKLQEWVSRDPGSVHARGGDGQTPLHFASTVEIAAYLLDHGADIDALDVDHESTPAQYMVADRQELVRYLIARGCKTDILMAAAVGDVALVRNKLDADADSIRTCVSDEYFPMIGKRTGGTIYQWTLGWYVSAHQVARRFGRDDVLQLLFERSPLAVKLIAACWLNDEATLQTVRAEHSDIAAAFTAADRRQTAHAARNNETAVVRRLLESGLPADATSQHQATPLHWAAFHGNLEMTKTVLRFRPPLEATDADFGGTPLGWAIHGSEHGWHSQTGNYAGTVEALIEAGAKPPVEIEGNPAVQEVLRRLVQRTTLP